MLQVCTVVLTMIVAGPFGLFADDHDDEHWWPQFRGPNASGVAEDGEYPVEFGADKNVKLPNGNPR